MVHFVGLFIGAIVGFGAVESSANGIDALIRSAIVTCDKWEDDAQYWYGRDSSDRNWYAYSASKDIQNRAKTLERLKAGELVKKLDEHVGHTLHWRDRWETWGRNDPHTCGYAAEIHRWGHSLFSTVVSTVKGWASEVEAVDLFLVPVVQFAGGSSGSYKEEKTITTGYSTTSYDSTSSATISSKASAQVNVWQHSGSASFSAQYDSVFSSFGAQTHRQTTVQKTFGIAMTKPAYIYVGKMRVTTKDGGFHEFDTDVFVQLLKPANRTQYFVPVSKSV